RTTIEKTLAEIWAKLLRLEQIGVTDNFFALGGDSILAIQLVSRARRAGVELVPQQIFEYQTIAELASVAKEESRPDREPEHVSGRVELTPIQRWFFEQEQPERSHYNQSMLLTVDERMEDGVLEAGWKAVVEHHDGLRLRYRQEETGWEQRYGAAAGIELERV